MKAYYYVDVFESGSGIIYSVSTLSLYRLYDIGFLIEGRCEIEC